MYAHVRFETTAAAAAVAVAIPLYIHSTYLVQQYCRFLCMRAVNKYRHHIYSGNRRCCAYHHHHHHPHHDYDHHDYDYDHDHDHENYYYYYYYYYYYCERSHAACNVEFPQQKQKPDLAPEVSIKYTIYIHKFMICGLSGFIPYTGIYIYIYL